MNNSLRLGSRQSMRRNAQALFSAVILLLGIWALIATRDWPIKTALYPRVIGVPLVLLAAIETMLSLRGTEEEKRQAVDTMMSSSLPAQVVAKRTVVTCAWLIGFFLVIFLIGFPRAVPLFVFANLKFQGRESWPLSIGLAAIAWLGFHLIFIRVLHLPFSEGLLWQVFR